MRFLLSFFSALICYASLASEGIKIGIYHKEPIHRIAISPAIAEYHVSIDGKVVVNIVPGELIYVRYDDGRVTLSSKGKWIGSGQNIVFYSSDVEALCRVKPTSPVLEEHLYADVISIKAKRGILSLVNEVEMHDYVGGSVEAESGKGQGIEYYKAQAILCRTYALSNRNKHLNEGFHLCDKVHCQVYHGISAHEALIPLAVEATENLIAVDSHISPIESLFHSNCGGHTVSAADVWMKALPYCRAKVDTFCLSMPHSNWEKTISKVEWLTYLSDHHQLSDDSLAQRDVLTHWSGSKQTHFQDGDLWVPLTKIRRDWQLRSTFFVITESEDSILFTGQGFGHGVGLCQEGAMRMSELDYDYDQILHYYFTDIHLINKRLMAFYRDDQ